VSRDSDYGVTVDGKSYINDHLRQEFSDRVSRKRHLLLYARVSEALKHFKVPVSAAATKAESDLVGVSSRSATSTEQTKILEVVLSRLLDRSTELRVIAEQLHRSEQKE